MSAFMSRTFFFQQNDTKINDFDEGVFWGNVIFKFAPIVSKVTFEVGGISLSSSPGL